MEAERAERERGREQRDRAATTTVRSTGSWFDDAPADPRDARNRDDADDPALADELFGDGGGRR